MIGVVDASAVIDLLLGNDHGSAVDRLFTTTDELTLMTVAHLDAEVLSALARLNRSGQLSGDEVGRLLRQTARLAVQRLPITGNLLAASWRLRDNIAMRDALYVAATKALGARLVTTDERLARAVPGLAMPL